MLLQFAPFLALCLLAPSAFSAQGNAFNPDISANFLGIAQHGTAYSGDRSVKPHNGLDLQEAELQFSADVDPYLRAVALLSFSQEDGKTSYGVDPEEIYAETISLPWITLRAGKFKMAFGRHNQLHSHAYPFIDAPLIHQRLLGEEGLNENAVSAAALLPAPWFSELTLQALGLQNESLFKSRNSGDLGTLAHFKNLWDLNDSLTMELGLSGVAGRNEFGNNASLVGSDLTFKWRPAEGGKYRALIWSWEYLLAQRVGLADATTLESQQKLGGLATWLQYQFAERWWVQGRYEYVGMPRSQALNVATKESALLAFLPSEFSALRLQYDWIQDQARSQHDHAIAFQYNISIGAHPAHAY
jgi:hypothetical protein